MNIFDIYDQIIENIQQIPLDVYLFIKRNERLNKQIQKQKKRFQRLTRKSTKGIIIDEKEIEEVFTKLKKLREKYYKSVEILENVMNKIKQRSIEIKDNECAELVIPKLAYNNINRVVKVGKMGNKGPDYCSCKQKAFDSMIACDNVHCKIKWFHFECVGITLTPKNIWYCPECRKLKEFKIQ